MPDKNNDDSIEHVGESSEGADSDDEVDTFDI